MKFEYLTLKSDTMVIDVRPQSEVDLKKIIQSDRWVNILHYELRPMFKLSSEDFKVRFNIAKQ